MGEAVLNYPVQRIVPQNLVQNDTTYALRDGDGNALIPLPYEAVSEMIRKHEDILVDLANENLIRTEYWQRDGIIIYSMRQSIENANPAPVLYIQRDDAIVVVLEREACDLMIRMAKIIRHHEQNDRIDEYSLEINTQKRIEIDIRENRLTIVDEVHDEKAVTFPLIVLAYLWTRYGDIHRELKEGHSTGTIFWSDDNLTIRHSRFENKKRMSWIDLLDFHSTSAKLSIILRTFKDLLKETTGDYFSEEASSDESDGDEAAMPLSQGKTFQFPVPGRPDKFRIKNEYNKCYSLPTAALDAAIQNIDEINSDLGGNVGNEEKRYWFDKDYTMCTFAHKNHPRGTDECTIKFNRRRDGLLLVAYTAETFASILEEYQKNRPN